VFVCVGTLYANLLFVPLKCHTDMLARNNNNNNDVREQPSIVCGSEVHNFMLRGARILSTRSCVQKSVDAMFNLMENCAFIWKIFNSLSSLLGIRQNGQSVAVQDGEFSSQPTTDKKISSNNRASMENF
jgi:hypothetical protein